MDTRKDVHDEQGITVAECAASGCCLVTGSWLAAKRAACSYLLLTAEARRMTRVAESSVGGLAGL